MKKTNRNQNMPDQDLRSNVSANTASLNNSNNRKGIKEKYSNANLNQHTTRNSKQHYDDYTGTVENNIE